MTAMEISWKFIGEDSKTIKYYVNGKDVGNDDIGFEFVLGKLKKDSPKNVLIKMTQMSSFGGASLEGSLPFYPRIQEFKEALGEKDLAFAFI